MTTYAVTGATGRLGSHVIKDLRDSGVETPNIVAIVRNPEKAKDLAAGGIEVRTADYTDLEALTTALNGVNRLLLISGSEIGQRAPQHANVIKAAEAAGVELLAYTSILRADSSPLAMAKEHVETEELLAKSPLTVTLLRNGWYWENYTGTIEQDLEGGVFYGAAGEGKAAGAAIADYAAAASTALQDARGGEVYELNGSQRLTHTEIAATISEIGGKPVKYQDLPEADYTGALVQAGLPEHVASILGDADARTADGGLDSTATDLETLIGRTSTPFADAVRAALTS